LKCSIRWRLLLLVGKLFGFIIEFTLGSKFPSDLTLITCQSFLSNELNSWFENNFSYIDDITSLLFRTLKFALNIPNCKPAAKEAYANHFCLVSERFFIFFGFFLLKKLCKFC
jgi:hypothetical protein